MALERILVPQSVLLEYLFGSSVLVLETHIRLHKSRCTRTLA